MHWKVQQRFGFVKIEGSLKFAIPAVDGGHGHRYLTEIDAFASSLVQKNEIETAHMLWIYYKPSIHLSKTWYRIKKLVT